MPKTLTPMRPLARMAPLVLLLVATPAAVAQDSPYVKLLRSGRVPEARQGTIVEMIGKRGGAADLAFLFGKALEPGGEGFSKPVRLQALAALADAALTRKVRPEGDLAKLAPLLKADADPEVRRAAVRLAGLWKVEALGPDLKSLAEDAKADPALRDEAIEALAEIGGAAGRASIEALAAPDRPWEVRARAVAALARFGVKDAAERAVGVIRDAKPGADLVPLMAAFLNRQGGADTLAAAIAAARLPADAAKMGLRATYALGHADPPLIAALSQAAGLGAEVQPLDQAGMDRLVAEVAETGDPARGEDIFRRADLNCTQCHAVAAVGGGVGPELSALGGSSPVDYIVNAIMLPDQAIKEEFHTLVVLTADGQVFHGIVVDKDADRYVLKEATGERRTIPADEVEDQKEGGSLMPKGLVNLMTHAEFVDLVRFLSELGKPGPYGINPTPMLRRWRVLAEVPEGLAKSVPDALPAEVVEADEARWRPAYAKVSGALPLAPLASATGARVLVLRGELDVTAAGPVRFRLDSGRGVRAWVDGKAMPPGDAFTAELDPGRHALVLRVDAEEHGAGTLTVELQKPEGSAVEFTPVVGK